MAKCKFCGAEVTIGERCTYCGSKAEGWYYSGEEKKQEPKKKKASHDRVRDLFNGKIYMRSVRRCTKRGRSRRIRHRMKIRYNRFAVFPVMCHDCHRYIWMEPYRRADVWHNWLDRYVKKTICNECLKKYDVGGKQ